MKMVSKGYKATMAMPVRPTSQFQARLEMTDRGVERDSAVSHSATTPFATGIFDRAHECDYITFEQNLMKVGGDDLIAPASGFLGNGFVSEQVSDGFGSFGSNAPVIEVRLNAVKSFVGMTYTFAKTYPAEFNLQAYLGNKLVADLTVHPDALYFVDEVNHIPDCDRVKFTFRRMSEPYRRLRISRMVFGLVKIFDNSNVLSINHDMQIDPISSSLPSNTLTMNVLNFDKNYNPDNPQGMWEYFSNGLPLQVRYGTVVNGEIEWVDSAYLYLSDAPTVRENTATFQASDAISYLTDTYYHGQYREDGISLYDLAVDVLSDAGVTAYELPLALKEVKTYAPMPVVTHRECLQIIANAGRCVLHTDVSGRIVMELQLNADVTITDNGHLPWADSTKTKTGGVKFDYITFEPNKWQVGGSQRLIVPNDTADCKPTCFVSSAMSDGRGRFGDVPRLYVGYSLPVSSYQFQITFDTVNDETAPDFNVIFSKGSAVIKRLEVRGNTEVVYTVNEEIIGYDNVTIEILSTSRPNNRIRVEAIDNGRVTDFYLDFQLALSKPTVSKTRELKSVDVTVHSYTVRDSVDVLYDSGDIIVDGRERLQVSYSPSVDAVAVVTCGTLVSSELYAQAGFIEVEAHGTVHVSIEGHLLNEKQSTVSVKESRTGEVCPLDNPLISDNALAQDVGEWVGSYLKNRNTYETNFRQDFRLDANDMIYFQSDFEEMIPARITRLQYRLPGQTGAISVRRMG